MLPTAEEQARLRFYEASLVWAGRYPTPKRATDAELLSFWNLASDVLTSRVGEIETMEIRRGNGVGEWSEFTKLWHGYAAAFRRA
jgi:hypothetical protein